MTWSVVHSAAPLVIVYTMGSVLLLEHVSSAKYETAMLMGTPVQNIVCFAVPVVNSTAEPPIITACELLYWSK